MRLVVMVEVVDGFNNIERSCATSISRGFFTRERLVGFFLNNYSQFLNEHLNKLFDLYSSGKLKKLLEAQWVLQRRSRRGDARESCVDHKREILQGFADPPNKQRAGARVKLADRRRRARRNPK
ncbi:hypothetical protein KSP40_PGU008644 [Platanthera guangdongensis]|uniref:Uncharacterized protein n=1 Tax=Platanthera guangdongensis TaxID=2320717 RepID=A0ABR2LJ70_9ASPA